MTLLLYLGYILIVAALLGLGFVGGLIVGVYYI